MTNREIAYVSEVMRNRVFASKDEIFEILNQVSSDRKVSNLRFYLFDLVRNNIIYKFDETRYKYCGNLKQFTYEFTDFDNEIKTKLESRFEGIQLCVWNTSFLSKYLNLMPYEYFTFIETDKMYLELAYDFLKQFYSVLYLPNQKELYYYSLRNHQLILGKLISRAPLHESRQKYIGINYKSDLKEKVVLRPTIEKILVDIYVEVNTYSVFEEIHQIYKGILRTYCVNFQKLYYYAKNRGQYEKIKQFIEKDIGYNVKNGDFK